MDAIWVENAKCCVCGEPGNLTLLDDGDPMPAPGDVIVCGRCGSMLTYTRKLGTRLLNRREIETAPQAAKIYSAHIIENLGAKS